MERFDRLRGKKKTEFHEILKNHFDRFTLKFFISFDRIRIALSGAPERTKRGKYRLSIHNDGWDERVRKGKSRHAPTLAKLDADVNASHLLPTVLINENTHLKP